MGVYDNLSITQSPNTNTFTSTYQTEFYQPGIITQEKKCKCPNPKHTNGCSIEPESEYCQWCAKGCRKRVMAVHVKYG